MAVAGKAMLKRSVRMFVEEEMEKGPHESYIPRKSSLEPHNPRKTSFKFDEARPEKVEGTSSTSSSTSQVDVDSSPSTTDSTTDCTDPGNTAGTDFDTTSVLGCEAGNQMANPVASKFSSSRQPPPFPKDIDLQQSVELSTRSYPPNFGVVVPGVYRSSYPQAEDYDSLKGLGLKTIITLVQKDMPAEYKSFIAANGIQHRVFDMQGTKKQEIPIKTMKSILRLVLDQQNHPLLIHCNHGRHRTGCVVAVVRKLTGWELSTIVHEYKTYAEPKVRECDVKYITAFNLATISNLFGREQTWHLRTWNFFRVSLFTTLVLLLWLFSGTKIVSHTTEHVR